jgi:monoamine oxidase
MQMAALPKEILDVAIVGGGISGLYSGWRLLTGRRQDRAKPPRRVVVFESSGRTGGRLLTWHPLPGTAPLLNAELGGMRFFKEQELVWSLIVKHFGKQKKVHAPIPFFVSDPNGNNLWYLRETVLKGPDLTNPERLPYRLDALGRYAAPDTIINNVIGKLLGANRDVVAEALGGDTTPRNWRDWDAIKPKLRYRGRPMWDVGFWNLLWDYLSPETYGYVTDAFGYYSLTNNWNAAEATQVISSDFTQNPKYHTLQEGFDFLPQLVREEFEQAHGEVVLNAAVVSVDRQEQGLYRLRIQGAREPVRARHVILAMPRRSLELLRPTRLWRMSRVLRRGGPGPHTLEEHVRSVIPYPAFKLFLTYPFPWWRKDPTRIAAGRSVCDLPLRQTYYFPPVPKGFLPSEEPPLDGPGLVMASYDDLGTVPFWQMLEPTDRMKKLSDELMTKLNKEANARLAAGRSQRLHLYASQTQQALIDDPGFYFAPPEMVRHAQEQLSLVHRNVSLPDPIPLPLSDPRARGWSLAAYKDWSIDPFGGGWNFWAPLVDVRAVMERMRQPFPNESLYIVGEAYSGGQGWVEGALTTAEKMLRESFNLAPADWQPSNYYMGY